MPLVGYFEGIDSERGIEWRCADSLSLREFLLLGSREAVPDHSWLSRTGSRLPLEVHAEVFVWVLKRLVGHGLIRGDRIGVVGLTMEAKAAQRTIVRRDTGEGYREMLARLAKESGIETPTAEELIRFDRARKGHTAETPAELVADKGYHSRDRLKNLADGEWKTRISEKKANGFSRWHGDDQARHAVTNNRARLPSGVARQAFKLRAEKVERSFALVLDGGGMRRTWLCGQENVYKRYLGHIAGYNLGLIMSPLTGTGIPKRAADRLPHLFWACFPAEDGSLTILVAALHEPAAIAAAVFTITANH